MTAQIFNLRGQPVQSPAAPSRAGPLSGQLRLVYDAASPEQMENRRMRALMHLRNGMDLCRDEYGAVRLAEILVHAAEAELRQVEDGR